MQHITSVTSKGQVVIPKHYRDEFDIKIHDRIRFKKVDGMLVAEKISPVKALYGVAAGAKKSTKKLEKKTIKMAVLQKFS